MHYTIQQVYEFDLTIYKCKKYMLRIIEQLCSYLCINMLILYSFVKENLDSSPLSTESKAYLLTTPNSCK